MSIPARAAAGPVIEAKAVADWDGDGHQDIVAVDRTHNVLLLYPGESKRGYSSQPPVQIGEGWHRYRVDGVADCDGDGHQDLVAYAFDTDALLLYPCVLNVKESSM
nr:VCBS repeat-containing protein [Nonomuraea sp. K271]